MADQQSGRFFRGRGRTSKAQIERVGSAIKRGSAAAASHLPSVFIGLILAGFAGLILYLKFFIGYTPALGIITTAILMLAFWAALRSDPVSRKLVFFTGVFDIIVQVFLLSGRYPSIGNLLFGRFGDIILTIYSFLWPALGVVIFILIMLETFGNGERPPLIADILLLTFFVVGFFFVFPFIVAEQGNSYLQYTTLAQQQVETLERGVEVVSQYTTRSVSAFRKVWIRTFTCGALAGTGSTAVETCTKQEIAKLECEPEKDDPDRFESCVQEQLAPQHTATARIDNEGIASEISLKRVDQAYTFRLGDPPIAPSALLIVSIPEERSEVTIESTCSFKLGSETVTGVVSPSTIGPTREVAQEIFCQPTGSFTRFGQYSTIFEVTIKGMETHSSVGKVFLNPQTVQEIKSIKDTTERQNVVDELSSLAQQPLVPQDPAIVHFDVRGSRFVALEDSNRLLIDVTDPDIFYSFRVEDREKSDKGDIKKFTVSATLKPGITVDTSRCSSWEEDGDFLTQKSEVAPPGTHDVTGKILPSCFVRAQGQELLERESTDYFFEARMVYDYLLKETVPMTILEGVQ